MKRLIFTLLHDRGRFMLSRNFRLQAVGTIRWLFENYDFETVSRGLDELMVLDVTRGDRDTAAFASAVSEIAQRCFIPLTAGGGVRSVDDAALLLRHGADKVLVNTQFADAPEACDAIAGFFGRQCLVAGVDYVEAADGTRVVVAAHGQRDTGVPLAEWVERVVAHGAGEVVLQSVARDGTGMGLDLEVTASLGRRPEVPLILLGGVGRGEHIAAGFRDEAVDAVATANLFNFIGESFVTARREMIVQGLDVADWHAAEYRTLKGAFAPADGGARA
ncbi:MAG: HisA/HisF-related TIM barrel protein [Gemmatimonadota bacterium]